MIGMIISVIALIVSVVAMAYNTRTGIIRMLDRKYGKIIHGKLEIVTDDKTD